MNGELKISPEKVTINYKSVIVLKILNKFKKVIMINFKEVIWFECETLQLLMIYF